MTDERHKQRTNRVFKSLHKPLTYLGVERTLFYFVCVSAVGAFKGLQTTICPCGRTGAYGTLLKRILGN